MVSNIRGKGVPGLGESWCLPLYRVIKEGLSHRVTFERRHEGSEPTRYTDILAKNSPGVWNDKRSLP